MLSVGREINISQAEIVCRRCHWKGAGGQLLIGLIRINYVTMYLAACRCPACRGFDISRKGKLLEFRLPQPPDESHEDATSTDENSREENRVAMRK